MFILNWRIKMKTNKVMLITGATSGVGKALAEYYYKKNYK